MTEQLTIPWANRKTRFVLPEQDVIIEEVKEPWDVLLEAKFGNLFLATDLWQIAVEHGLHRVFSIRGLPARNPLATIITKPINARVLMPYWDPWRVLKTGNTMSINGEDLVVLAVLTHGREAPAELVEVARKFFVRFGGILGNEYPGGIIFSSKKQVRDWQEIYRGRSEKELICSTVGVPKELYGEECFRTTVVDIVEARVMLDRNFWRRIYLDYNEEWMYEILTHLKKHPEDRPSYIQVFNSPMKGYNKMLEEARTVMARVHTK